MWSIAQWKIAHEKREDEALAPLTKLAYFYYRYELFKFTNTHWMNFFSNSTVKTTQHL